RDYGSVPKPFLLDMVKVLTFALSEGKVAIHSHTGLGAGQGVLVSCYLIYTLRCKPTGCSSLRQGEKQLILLLFRPGQRKPKARMKSNVRGFAQFVVPMLIVFANV
ncbi:protein tyrosine phosphatase domain-containing protein 1, partial [Caerostris extrusa]